jgi:2,5-dioxopentanoate dehydrogenase
MNFTDNTSEEINATMQQSWAAFHAYRKLPLTARANFMRTIAQELEACGDDLIHAAMKETNLPEARLRNERGRTILQLNQYAAACEDGAWLEASIDRAIPDKTPPKPDIRKMLVPLGPVVVFGSSNFPFAYSTAGGDTASALAAGCPVVVKAHPAHVQTSTIVAQAILKAADKCNMPRGIFAHIYGASFEVGKALVNHAYTKAVGFTGSFSGGKQLFDWANQRAVPIPVFAEMGSVNPVFLLPEKLAQDAAAIAKQFAGSITLGVGQFCTKPGLLIGLQGAGLTNFIDVLGNEIKAIAAGNMLHTGIAIAYAGKKTTVLEQDGVKLLANGIEANSGEKNNTGLPVVAVASGKEFLNNPVLHQEVFGPFALVINCADDAELLQVAQQLEGQLTTTIMATDTDMRNNDELVELAKDICGRLIINGVPTGVEVCLSMQHGGPFPASTDSRYGSVGADGIKRFARPLSFQNWSNDLLPDELKDGNPLGIRRRELVVGS